MRLTADNYYNNKDKKPLLSKVVTVVGDDSAPKKEILLKDYGKIVEKYLN